MSEPVYRGLTREQLDAQMNLRARWPEHAEIFERWARDSRAVRERAQAFIDLAYGQSAGERLDLFPVPGDRAAPLFAFIHGGYWQSLDKSDFSYLAPALTGAGIAYASLNYDLAPKADIGTMVRQTQDALAWLYTHAAGFGVDPDRIYVGGHSAGGHLAAMALDRRWPGERGLPDDLVKGGLSISGVYDLEAVRQSYHQPVMRLDADQVEAFSPLRAVPRNAGPLRAAVGGDETEEFRRQQDEALAAWQRAGIDVAAVQMPGYHHFDIVDALTDPGNPLFQALLDLMALDREATA